MTTIDSIEKITFPVHKNKTGELTIYEQFKDVPFEIRRIFVVNADIGEIRGKHSHLECTQLLICLSGEIKVTCDDGSISKSFIISKASDGLLIPPGIWAHQKYLSKGSILIVICDREYLESDYIRDYKLFVETKS